MITRPRYGRDEGRWAPTAVDREVAVEDATARLATARAQLEELATGSTAAEQASRRPVTEYDRTGTVSVEVGADGRVQRVRVASAWRRTLGPDGVGPAIQEAVVAAGLARTTSWAEELGSVSGRPSSPRAAPHRTLAATAEVAAVRAAAGDPDRELRNLQDLVAQMRETLTLVSTQLAARAGAVHERRSLAGHVTVTVGVAGEVRRVDLDHTWSSTAQPADLAREATEAIVAAQQEQQRAAEDPAVTAALTEARRLAADPVAVARRLARP